MITAFHQPTALKAALALVAKGATPVAGATALYTAKREREIALVDIKRLGLSAMAVRRREIVLGATTTLTRIADADELTGPEGELLRRAAGALSARTLRNAITLGGNIVHVAYWADMPVALLALDARVEVQRAGAKAKVVAFADAIRPRAAPWKGGLLTRVLVPRRARPLGVGYERFARTSADYALATVCAVVGSDGARARDVRVVVGALQARPFRVPEVEALLVGEVLDEGLIAKAADELGARAPVAPSFRTELDYRKKLVRVLARRALEAAWARAGRAE